MFKKVIMSRGTGRRFWWTDKQS